MVVVLKVLWEQDKCYASTYQTTSTRNLCIFQYEALKGTTSASREAWKVISNMRKTMSDTETNFLLFLVPSMSCLREQWFDQSTPSL